LLVTRRTRHSSPTFGTVSGRFDRGLLPIAAYEPRWFMNVVHMNPAEAVQAHLDLHAPASVGMHFGAFQMTAEGIDEPLQALNTAREARGIGEALLGTIGFENRCSCADLGCSASTR
jgi:Beta-lactamase superfamily domain